MSIGEDRAFPLVENQVEGYPANPGMSTRTYAAIHIAAGMHANPHVWEEMTDDVVHAKALERADDLLARLEE